MTTTLQVPPVTGLTDVELARSAGRGDNDAFDALYTRHAGALAAFLRARVPGEAGALVENVWTRIAAGLDTFDGQSFRTWAFSIARSAMAGALEGVEPFSEHRDGLARCLEGLSRAEMQVVRARLEGIESARIAERGKVPVERVHSLFLQASARLAGCLEAAATPAPLVLDLPDEPAAMGPWLDRQVVGMQLSRLVAELEAVHGGRTGESPPRALVDVLSEHLPAVLDSGLGALPRPSLREVLRQPRLLLDLQERVLTDGGPYWIPLQAEDAEVTRAVETGRPLVRSIRNTATPPVSPAPPVPPEVRPEPARAVPAARPADRPPRVLLLRIWARGATAVASALLFLYLSEHLDPQLAVPARLPAKLFASRTEWGWNRPGLLIGSGKAADYLTVLAESASEWFDERPSTLGNFALRLGELRTGCSRMIVAGHENLPPADKAWLVEHGRDWAAEIDDAVHALERGEPIERVSPLVDGTVNRLIDALRDRARAARGSSST